MSETQQYGFLKSIFRTAILKITTRDACWWNFISIPEFIPYGGQILELKAREGEKRGGDSLLFL